MPWEPPRRNQRYLHCVFYSAESRRFERTKTVRIALFIILALGLWYSLQSTPSTELRVDYSVQTFSPLEVDPVDFTAQRPPPKSVVGKVHAIFGEPNPTYERALRLHQAHAERNGHPMFVLRRRILSGLWSKPAFILSVILQELEKPEESRLKWLM